MSCLAWSWTSCPSYDPIGLFFFVCLFALCIIFVLPGQWMHQCLGLPFPGTSHTWSVGYLFKIKLIIHLPLLSWLESEISPTGSCVKLLVPRCYCYFGRFWNFVKWGIAGSSRSLVVDSWGYPVPGPSLSLALLPFYQEVNISSLPHVPAAMMIYPSSWGQLIWILTLTSFLRWLIICVGPLSASHPRLWLTGPSSLLLFTHWLVTYVPDAPQPCFPLALLWGLLPNYLWYLEIINLTFATFQSESLTIPHLFTKSNSQT
jgi:hypothetical protein